MKAPNAFRAWIDGYNRVEYKRKREGDNLYIVTGFDGQSWIPIQAVVFSNTKANAIKAVKNGIDFVAKKSCTHSSGGRTARRMLDTLKFECHVANKNQIYMTDWADNSGPF